MAIDDKTRAAWLPLIEREAWGRMEILRLSGWTDVEATIEWTDAGADIVLKARPAKPLQFIAIDMKVGELEPGS